MAKEVGVPHAPDNNENDKNKKQTQQDDNQEKEVTALEYFSDNLNDLAMEGKLDPCIGREIELQRVIQIISRRKKNNAVLIGEPGVGKTSIAEGLAIKIINKDVPSNLIDKKIFNLNVNSIVAGAMFRGQFEQRMKDILNEIKERKDVILFIDELHTLVGAGAGGGSLDASNIFKPALSKGELQCIGATTLNEYREWIERDGALERRFQKVIVDPPTVEQTIEILQNIKPLYEKFHNVVFDNDAIIQTVKLADKYISDRFFPDKAIDIIDEAGAKTHTDHLKIPNHIKNAFIKYEADIKKLNDEKYKLTALGTPEGFTKAGKVEGRIKTLQKEFESEYGDWYKEKTDNPIPINLKEIANIVSMITNVPVNHLTETETQKILRIEDVLTQNVINQNQAIKLISETLQRNHAGLKPLNRPIGSFIFLGPTGVGKSEVAKQLATYLFGSPENMIRIDMSEYMEKFNVSRLIGSPPGYVGYDQGGQLTEKVRRHPYSIILLDEIEKAHPDVFNMFLQVLDDGILTDGQGRKISFKNTIIIMTSNLGTADITNNKSLQLGFSIKSDKQVNDYTRLKEKVMEATKKFFRPEFLNRLDELVVFNPLTKADLMSIIDLMLAQVELKVQDRGIKFNLTTKAKEFLIDKGYDIKNGARPLKRAIQTHLENKISIQLLKGLIKDNSTINIDYDKEKDELIIR